MANQQWEAHRDQNLRDALHKIQMLEEHQQAAAVGTAPTLPTTQAYPSSLSGHTTGLTIGQPQVTSPNPAHRGPWATTRERYQQQVPLPTTPCMAGVSVGVPSVAAPSGVASTHGAAFPAMAVPNPTTPLGAFPTQTPLPAGQPHTGDEYFKREKSPLPKLVIKSGDATTITRIVHGWVAEDGHGSQHLVVFSHPTLASCCWSCKECTCPVDPYGSQPTGFADWVAIYW